MAGGNREVEVIEKSLQVLRECHVCRREVEQLKILRCLHNICLQCAKNLYVYDGSMFKCPTCGKEIPLPNGGFDYAADNALTNLLTEEIKRRREANDITTITLKDLDMSGFKNGLQEELDAAERWCKQASGMALCHKEYVDELKTGVTSVKEKIQEYKQETDRLCSEKLEGLKIRLNDEKEELAINKATLLSCIETWKLVPTTILKLKSKDCTSDEIVQAQELLEKLGDLLDQVGHLQNYFDTSVELEVGDSVRLKYSVDENIEDFIRGKVTHASVGILAYKPQKQNEKFLVLFPKKHSWKAMNLNMLTKSFTKSTLPFIGEQVTVDLTQPYFGQQRLRGRKFMGVLRKIEQEAAAPDNDDDLVVRVDFADVKKWKGLYREVQNKRVEDPLGNALCGSRSLKQITYPVEENRKQLLEITPAPGHGHRSERFESKKLIIPSAEIRKDLRRKLQKQYEAGNPRVKNARCMIKKVSKMTDQLANQQMDSRRAIIEYQIDLKVKSEKKLQEEQIGADKMSGEMIRYTAILCEYLQTMKPAIINASQSLTAVVNSHNVSVKSVIQAQRNFLLLKAGNAEVRAIRFGVGSFYEPEPGDCVRLRVPAFNLWPMSKYLGEGISFGSVGLLLNWDVRSRKAKVLFHGDLSSREVPYGPVVHKVLTQRRIPFKNDKVTFKIRPITDSEDNVGSYGVLTQLFPEAIVEQAGQQPWRGSYGDIELAPCGKFQLGDQVWVRREIPKPCRGWGGVDSSSVGTVVRVDVEEITVRFPECPNWIGMANELQMTRKVEIKDKVQVKHSVRIESEDSQFINHDSIGTLCRIDNDGTCLVVFENQNSKIHIDKIEPLRYHPAHYDTPTSEVGNADILVSPDALHEFIIANRT